MKIIFMGTPDFAVPSLERLIEEFEVCAVVTQPDRPKGRGKKLAFSPVKEVAVKNNIPVFQPQRIKNESECINALKALAPDFVVVVAFGQILPKEVLDIPKYGCINLHASLLPKLRGAAPINWAIINGDKLAGNTTMLMDVGLDTGDMLLKQEFEVTDDMTAGELHNLLMVNGADLLVETLNNYSLGKIIPQKQEHELSNYAPMLNKEMAEIKWESAASSICNLIRGLNPWPAAFTKYEDQVMKIYMASPTTARGNYVPGTIVKVSREGILVSAGEGMVLIKKLQFPSGKVLSVDEFLRGNKIKEGIVL